MILQLSQVWKLCVFATLVASSGAASAQQPAQNPVAPPAAAQPAVGEQQPAAAFLETNPAVQAALEWPRNKPRDAFQAVVALADLGRPELAKPILEELQTRGLAAGELAALVEQFGSHRMLQLARDANLSPVGAAFADACMSAANAIATDPQRIAQLIAQLADPAADVRLAARVDLAAASQAGAVAVLEALAREPDANRRAAFANAAQHMHPLVVGPLLGMIHTNDPQLRDDVARLLTALRVPQATPLLIPINSPSAEAALRRALDEYERGTPLFAPDADNHIVLWMWNDATKSLASQRYPADAARTIWMARLAQRLAKLRPENPAYYRRGVVLGLESVGWMSPAQFDDATSPANRLVQSLEARFLSQVLSDSLAANFAHAAAAACDELGRRGDPNILITPNGQPSPLAEALVHPNRRVQFAALRAIVKLDPSSPYPGSSRVPEALAYFARSSGQRTALIAMPTNMAATDVAGKLAAAGFRGEATNLGADVVRLARDASDLEIVLIDMNIQAPDVRQVLFELRTTSPAGQVPVALLAADGRLDAAHRLADEHQRMIAVPRPHTTEACAKIAAQLFEIAPPNAVTAEERALQSVEAVTWIAGLIDRGRTFYALRRESPTVELALYRPATATSAIAALARFGTPDSQRALANFASQRTLPIDSRRQAAVAFDHSVKARGLLLNRDEILAQYSQYNASATADPDTQQVLAALLDTIESRRPTPANAAAQL